MTSGFKDVTGKKQAQFVVFSIRKKQNKFARRWNAWGGNLIDRHVQTLFDQVGNKMLMGYVNASAQP